MQANTMRQATVYLIATVMLAVYGAQVCPLLEQLSFLELAAVLAVFFVLGHFVTILLLSKLMPVGVQVVAAVSATPSRQGRPAKSRPVAVPVSTPPPMALHIPWTRFRIHLATWILVGAGVTVFNWFWYGFPIFGSGAKLAVGCVLLGLFDSAHAALDEQRRLIEVAERAAVPNLPSGRFVSILTQVQVFLAVLTVVACGALLLVLHKDFVVLRQAAARGASIPFTEVIIELAFVGGTLLGAGMWVAQRMSRNIKLLFELEIRALEAIQKGDLERWVPIVSHDEFSRIAVGTNEMIRGLKERERLKKFVSPTVAAAILSAHGGELGGREAEVAILFTDLRNFTTLSEKLDPAALVALLNTYFAGVVGAIHKRGGVLDKFIGDAALAVFGLDGSARACENALDAAAEIRKGLVALNERVTSHGIPALDNGIGIHFGSVVAGNIGTPERMEYTVIGDTVNTATRIEGLTKDIGHPVLVSAAIHSRVDDRYRSRLTSLGAHALKGKAQPVEIYAFTLDRLPS